MYFFFIFFDDNQNLVNNPSFMMVLICMKLVQKIFINSFIYIVYYEDFV